MINKFREAKFLTNGFFGPDHRSAPPIGVRFLFGALFSHFGLYFMILHPIVGILITLMIFSVFFWGYLSVRRGYPKPINSRKGIDHNISARMNNYFASSKEERKLYPRDINSIVKNPLLTNKQLHQINEQMIETHQAILNAREAEARLNAKNIDISDVLDILKERRASLEIKTNTYNEFAKKGL